jgi:CBS domain containing-hemolysin-like protein
MTPFFAALLLFFLGCSLGFVFAGSETAFYRIPKLRLKLDALAQDRTAGRLLWFVNRPDVFVATILVGNNVSNYAVSMATVLFVGCLLPHAEGIVAEIGSTLILAPFLFVYGEMFPKYLCLNAPTLMLRLFAPIILLAYRLFMPLTSILWGINHIMFWLLGRKTEMITMTMGRRELGGILNEGKETGILFDAQQRLANGIFDLSNQQIRHYVTPVSQSPLITANMKPDQVLRFARRLNLTEMPVYEENTEYPTNDLPVGYVRTIDLEIAVHHQLDEQSRQLMQLLQTDLPIRSTVEISHRHSLLTGMILLQTQQGSFGSIVDEHRRCLGFVHADRLRDVLLGNKTSV